MTQEERINKAIEPLDKLIAKTKKLLDHLDAVTLTDAYESLSEEREIINLNNPK
jgi:hypothetical protein